MRVLYVLILFLTACRLEFYYDTSMLENELNDYVNQVERTQEQVDHLHKANQKKLDEVKAKVEESSCQIHFKKLDLCATLDQLDADLHVNQDYEAVVTFATPLEEDYVLQVFAGMALEDHGLTLFQTGPLQKQSYQVDAISFIKEGRWRIYFELMLEDEITDQAFVEVSVGQVVL